MKKYLAIMMCAGLLLTTTGCGEKKEEDSSKDDTKVEEKTKDDTEKETKATNKILSCSQEDEDGTINITFTYDLDGKTFSKATYNISATVPEDDDDLLSDEDYQELASSFCDTYADEEIFKNCDAKISGGKLTVTVDVDIDKLDDGDAEFTKNTPIDELKELLEEDEATCTIEEK